MPSSPTTPTSDVTVSCPAVYDHLGQRTDSSQPGVQDLCTATGVRVEYPLPYSPDFNPIEKAWMQEHRVLVAAFGADFAGFLVHALETCPNRAVAYFEACHKKP